MPHPWFVKQDGMLVSHDINGSDHRYASMYRPRSIRVKFAWWRWRVPESGCSKNSTMSATKRAKGS